MNANTPKTVDQLKAEAEARRQEAEAARAALEAAEQAARDAERDRLALERQEKARIEAAAFKAKTDAIAAKLEQALQAAGVTVDVFAEHIVSIEEERHKISSWRYSSTGNFVIVVRRDRYSGRALRFLVKANGSMNTDKIVAAVKLVLQARAAEVVVRKQRATLHNTAAEICARINAAFPDSPVKAQPSIEGYYPKGSGRSEYYQHLPTAGKVYVNLGTPQCTEEQATILLEAYARAFPKTTAKE